MNENFEKCVNAFNNSSLKCLPREEQKKRLGYEAKEEYAVFIEENTGAVVFFNTKNGNVAFEIASEELPFEVIENIYRMAEFYNIEKPGGK